jgi:hypothetical protein
MKAPQKIWLSYIDKLCYSGNEAREKDVMDRCIDDDNGDCQERKVRNPRAR